METFWTHTLALLTLHCLDQTPFPVFRGTPKCKIFLACFPSLHDGDGPRPYSVAWQGDLDLSSMGWALTVLPNDFLELAAMKSCAVKLRGK